MNADGFMRIINRFGQNITLRRMSGPQRIPFDVVCRASVQVGADSVVVGGMQQTADKIMLSSREIDAAQWPGPPRHGDLIIYPDGRPTTIQGRADVHFMDGGDRVFVVRTLGGS